jgi:2-phospho-L-lactate guanylyltransferase
MAMETVPEATWAIVPVKPLGHAKQRLAGALSMEARRRLMLVMLQEVLATLASVKALGPVLVVTPDAHAAELARACGARVLTEERALGHSAAASAGFTHAAAQGAAQALTVPADAPCMTCEELSALIDAAGAGAGPRVVLAPSRDGDGTNALLAVPPTILPPSFGPGSFARHLAAAKARGLDCRVLELAGLGMDIDGPGDLKDLIARKQGDLRYSFLRAEAARLDELAEGAGQS